MTVRLLSLPANHRYVRHALEETAPGTETVRLLPDPPVPGAEPGVWWPSPALDPAWVADHAQEVDVVHLHFGFESRTPAQLKAWTRSLAQHGIPLVLTVHDLTLPHSPDHAAHRARLDVLVPAADAVLTLTDGAAAAIRRRWGVPVTVVPHPHMVPVRRMAQVSPRRPGPLRVGLHLKSARANSGGTALLEPLATAAAAVGAQLVVHAHEELRDPGFVRFDPAVAPALERLAALPHVSVTWTDRMDDEELWDYLEGLDVSVLPHRWGTHSGWVEECHDLGVVPLVPKVGHLLEQAPHAVYEWEEGVPSSASLVDGLEAAEALVPSLRTPGAVAARVRARAAERDTVAAVHRRIYQEVVRSGERPASVAAHG